MVNIERALMLALTGVTPQEFQNLIPVFSQVWLKEKWKKHKKAKGRKLGAGRKGFFKSMEAKLFYALFYHKCSNL